MPTHPVYGEWSEEWRDVSGFEGIYEVNHMSEVRNKQTKHVLKCTRQYKVGLYDAKNKRFNKKVYHLSLLSFFSHIPRNDREVDHIDENFENHHLNNLQWCSRNFNSVKSLQLRPRMNGPACSKAIQQYSDGEPSQLIQEYSSINEASRQTGIPTSNLSNCLLNQRRSAGGFIWKFKGIEFDANEVWGSNHLLQDMLRKKGMSETNLQKVRISNMGRIITAYGVVTKGTKLPRTCYRRYRGYGVHQLVWAVWGDGRLPPTSKDNLQIHHNDKVPKDVDGCVSNAIVNLSLGTRRENGLSWHREIRSQIEYCREGFRNT